MTIHRAAVNVLQERTALRALTSAQALTAHLLKRLGRDAVAEKAYDRAIGLCEHPAMREFLAGQTRKPTEIGILARFTWHVLYGAGAAPSAFSTHNPAHNRCILVRLVRRLAVPAFL